MAAGCASVGFSSAVEHRKHLSIESKSTVVCVLLTSLAHHRSQKRTLSQYTPTKYGDDSVKDTFCDNLNRLLNKNPSDISVVAGEYNVQPGKLNTLQLDLGGRFAFGSPLTDNGDRLQ